MTKISRIPLRQPVWDRIFELFIHTFSNFTNKDDLKTFINDFFSPSERIIYAKRVALIIMLAKGNSYSTIRKILKLSPPTIAKMSNKVKYDSSGLKPVIDKLLEKQSSDVFWKEMKSLFDIPTKSTLKSLSRIINEKSKTHEVGEIKSGV